MKILIILFHKGKKMLKLQSLTNARLNYLGMATLPLIGALYSCVTSKYKNQGDRPVVDINQKNPRDKRQLKTLTLKNGLEVLLITDPEMNKSSAALDVKARSLDNPKKVFEMAWVNFRNFIIKYRPRKSLLETYRII